MFSKFRKNGLYDLLYYFVVLLVCYRHAKFEFRNSFFDKVMAKKNSKLMTSNIQTLFFLPLLTTYNKTKTTIGFPVMSCIE